MKNFFSNFILLIVALIVAFVAGMISPGAWLTARKQEINAIYYKMAAYPNVPPAENFVTTPFDLQLVYVKNPSGQLESYLFNSVRNEMLPILDVEGATQVGDLAHRFKGLGEEGRNKLVDAIESAKAQGSGALDSIIKLLGK